MSNISHLIRLHSIVLLSSLIPTIIILITIPAVEIVFIRTFFAAMLLGAFVIVKKINYRFETKVLFQLLMSGVFTSLYWILLFISAKIANASISLIGIATTAIWTSLIEPVINRGKFSKLQLVIAVNAFVGIWIIAYSEIQYTTGLYVGVIGGLFGALLTIINSKLSKKYNATVITFYQMSGAWIGTLIFIPFYIYYFAVEGEMQLSLTGMDWFYIMVLVVVFSIFIYSEFISLMKILSPFLVALTANLSPIYGMIAALVIFGESEVMNLEFYIGTLLIIISVFTYPLFKSINQ